MNNKQHIVLTIHKFTERHNTPYHGYASDPHPHTGDGIYFYIYTCILIQGLAVGVINKWPRVSRKPAGEQGDRFSVCTRCSRLANNWRDCHRAPSAMLANTGKCGVIELFMYYLCVLGIRRHVWHLLVSAVGPISGFLICWRIRVCEGCDARTERA